MATAFSEGIAAAVTTAAAVAYDEHAETFVLARRGNQREHGSDAHRQGQGHGARA